jgi:hypothetical protein
MCDVLLSLGVNSIAVIIIIIIIKADTKNIHEMKLCVSPHVSLLYNLCVYVCLVVTRVLNPYSKEQSPSSETTRFAGSQEIPVMNPHTV